MSWMRFCDTVTQAYAIAAQPCGGGLARGCRRDHVIVHIDPVGRWRVTPIPLKEPK
jgi:hypothetical protein